VEFTDNFYQGTTNTPAIDLFTKDSADIKIYVEGPGDKIFYSALFAQEDPDFAHCSFVDPFSLADSISAIKQDLSKPGTSINPKNEFNRDNFVGCRFVAKKCAENADSVGIMDRDLLTVRTLDRFSKAGLKSTNNNIVLTEARDLESTACFLSPRILCDALLDFEKEKRKSSTLEKAVQICAKIGLLTNSENSEEVQQTFPNKEHRIKFFQENLKLGQSVPDNNGYCFYQGNYRNLPNSFLEKDEFKIAKWFAESFRNYGKQFPNDNTAKNSQILETIKSRVIDKSGNWVLINDGQNCKEIQEDETVVINQKEVKDAIEYDEKASIRKRLFFMRLICGHDLLLFLTILSKSPTPIRFETFLSKIKDRPLSIKALIASSQTTQMATALKEKLSLIKRLKEKDLWLSEFPSTQHSNEN
jgi:hypothetical protein